MAVGRGKHSGRNRRFTACNTATLRQKAKFFAPFRCCRRWHFHRAGFMEGGGGLARKGGTSACERRRFRCRDLQRSIYRRRKRPMRRRRQRAKRKAEHFHAMPSEVRRGERCTTSGIFVNLVVGSSSRSLIPRGL